MILYNKNEVKIQAIKCKRPKMVEHRGRNWDQGHIAIDNEEKTVYLDTTWGFYCYFVENGQWYKIKMFNDSFYKPHYDLDPFLVPSYDLFTKKEYINEKY